MIISRVPLFRILKMVPYDSPEKVAYEGAETVHACFSRFRPQKSTLCPGISLIDRENSSDEIIFESLCIYLEHKYLKE